MTKITFIGCGVMASAIIDGMLSTQEFNAKQLELIEPYPNPKTEEFKKNGASLHLSADEIKGQVEVCLLAVKPQMIKVVFDQIRNKLNTNTLIISIMAGISMETIETGLVKGTQVIRVMPNLPASVKQGMSGYVGNSHVTKESFTLVEKILSSCGKALKVDSESMLDSITACAGSSPAYVYYIAEAIQKGAKYFGFNDEQSKLLAVQTMIGAATQLVQSGKEPCELRKMVTSPNGTTQAALESFSANQIDYLIQVGMNACRQRSIELGGTSKPMGTIPIWATCNPWKIDDENVHTIQNLLGGQWVNTKGHMNVIDPWTGKTFIKCPSPAPEEIDEFITSLKKCPKSGLHNPLKNVERYNLYGKAYAKIASELDKKDVQEFFIKLIQRVTPKSYVQAKGEINITRTFFQNFSGDQPRFLVRGFTVSGDHDGQQSQGYRFPYGPCVIVSPFNFPLEIPILQLGGALLAGNKVCLKAPTKVSIVMEQFLKLMGYCGVPLEDVDYFNGPGKNISDMCKKFTPRQTQFTGSQNICEQLCEILHGKMKVEDAGFDFKIIGPDVHDFDFVAYTCDQDAYAFGGQKCSAQSMLFMHENWEKAGLIDKLAKLSGRRTFKNQTIVPILSWSNEQILKHQNNCLSIPGSKVLFGGKPMEEAHTIPKCYGSWQPTAVYIPLSEILKSEKNFEIATTELFGPFQVITTYKDGEIDKVLEVCEKIPQHLTQAVVSKDSQFINYCLARTVNGTTYGGIRARTTGAPQNHWFGPSNDPRGAGIGTPEAIIYVWTHHREIIHDIGPVLSNWEIPEAS